MKQTSNFKLMLRMSGLVKPLAFPMLIAITLGVLGFLCAIFIPVLAAVIISHVAIGAGDFPFGIIFGVMVACAILRGVLHYGEQACNHYIAFKLLAILRDKVFKALRKLCPAKLESKDKGNLIFLITSDIEALEVFYAHTISPIVIAIITCLILLVMFAKLHLSFMIVALLAYTFVGIIIPMIITKLGKEDGIASRKEFGALSDYTLESLRGIQEVLQYRLGDVRMDGMYEKSETLNKRQKKLKSYEGTSGAIANMAIMSFSLMMVLCASIFYMHNEIDFVAAVVGSVLMVSSFGPVMALSNLSNNLLITMASSRRVLSLLDEEAMVDEVVGQKDIAFGDMQANHVHFAYDQEVILNDFSTSFKKGQITGLLGKSGSGKSTLLKLLMRFWDVNDGSITIHEEDIRNVNTANLRNMQSYVTQDTVLFHDSIENNIRIAKLDASHEEVMDACKKANIHDFIMTLPNGYETTVEELGESLSGGERQRLALARAFLHDADCILLDEPTSNLDALNEAAILKNLKDQKDKTIILVSHRPSTLKIADTVVEMETIRCS